MNTMPSELQSSFQVRQLRVRQNATARERRRLAEVNRAYSDLSNYVPQHLLGNATKLEVLRGAACYIRLLSTILASENTFDYRYDYHGGARSATSDVMDNWDRNDFFNRSAFSHFLETFRYHTMHYEKSPSAENGADPLDQPALLPSFQPGVLRMDDPPPKANISWR
ncbi:uncharacterized protein [Diadema setosum]|uniref:uncharacterized protein n=1 Tax=Diadema setosum TaxID=31175 RepID=UPI003B3B89CA